MHNNIPDFFDYNSNKQMSGERLVVGFYSHLDILSILEMNDEVKSHLLLKQAIRKSHDKI